MNAIFLGMSTRGNNAFVFVGASGWGPVIDDALVPAQPTDAGIKVLSVIGSTTQEATFIVYLSYGNSSPSLNETDYNLALVGNFGSLATKVNSTYPLSLYNNTAMPTFYALATLDTLYSVHCTAYRALRSPANKAPVYTYSFNHTPSCTWLPFIPQDVIPKLEAPHTAEIPVVFGNLNQLPFGTGSCNFTDAEVALSTYMEAAWTSMAESGNPGPGWPQSNLKSSQGNLFNDVPVLGVVDSMCAFWDEITAEFST